MAATFQRKYGVVVSGSDVISIPLIKAGVTTFALPSDITFSASDVQIRKDGGSWANITNLPIGRIAGSGCAFDFFLTSTEMQAKQVQVLIADSITKAIEDDYFIIETYGNPSAMQTIDYTTIKQDANGYFFTDVAAVSGTVLPNPINVGYFPVNTVTGNVQGFVNVSGINLSVQNTLADNIMVRTSTNWEASASGVTLGSTIIQSHNSTVNGNVLEIKKTDNSLLMTKTLTKSSDNPIRAIS